MQQKLITILAFSFFSFLTPSAKVSVTINVPAQTIAVPPGATSVTIPAQTRSFTLSGKGSYTFNCATNPCLVVKK